MNKETQVTNLKISLNGKFEEGTDMVSVDKAHSLIAANCHSLESINIPLEDSLGFVLSENIYSPLSLPPFPQSAMDGFAMRFSDLMVNDSLEIIGEIPAGNTWKQALDPAAAVRIFTGARVPEDADIVVEQERAVVKENRVYIQKDGLAVGVNIRKEASQIGAGELAMEKGEALGPAAIGFLAAMGISSVSVFNKPEIAIIVTGNELQQAGSDLKDGNIYESNSLMLRTALEQIGFKVSYLRIVQDNDFEIESVFQKYIDKVDALILTGGISVGDYDLIRKKLESDQVQKIFYKVKQKPGKPFWFGLSGKTRIFALPGNPAAVLTCFYRYVYPALRKMSGNSRLDLPSAEIPLLHDYSKKIGLAHFLKAFKSDSGLRILEGQESFKLNSYSKANCLAYIPEDVPNVFEGEKVKVYFLPIIH